MENRRFPHRTPNLEEAIPILEKWFDDIHAESERQKKLADENQQSQQTSAEQTASSQEIDQNQNVSVSSPTTDVVKQVLDTPKTEAAVSNNDVATNNEVTSNTETVKSEENVDSTSKGKVSVF